jgi:hypothetical protein
MPSRRELSKAMREAGVDASYFEAFKRQNPAYKTCVKRVGDRIVGDVKCLKSEGQKLKDAYQSVWTF